jgi:hypothetical protein
VLLHRPTKLFWIPVISIRTTSVVSVILLCNKLVPKRFHSQPRVLAEVRECYFQDTTAETPVRSAKEIKTRQGVGRERRADVIAASPCRGRLHCVTTGTPTWRPWLQPQTCCSPRSLRLPRFRVVGRKLKIASGGAVPLGHSEIVLIDRF